MSEPDYAITALRYAHHERRSPENFVGGDPHDVEMPLDFYVWVIAGGGRTILVDTGFGQDSANRRGREITKPVGEGLRTLGLDPATIEDVVITHLHYDHCGNDGLFPAARFHLQDSEMAFATGRCMGHEPLRHAYEVDDVVAMVRRVYRDRVAFHDGADELAPGITLHHIGGHTRGLQVVRVKTRRGWVVLAADSSHFYAHFQQRRVFPIVDSVAQVLEGYDTLDRLASSRDHIIPGHDPLVARLYPAARPDSAGWAVRLDADPKSA